jgi:SAM-dependent methyltransferase
VGSPGILEPPTWPAVRAYKEHSYRLLDEATLVLDVGCGPGVDLVRLGVGRAIGVDPSITMCRRARQSEAAVCQAAAEALPFQSGAVGGCRADRVLQHVSDPTAAVAEMIRVTRTGGVVVAAEPDQESLVIAVPGVSADLCDRVKALRRDVGYRNGRLASRLPELFGRLGLSQVSVEAFPLVLTDPGDAFGLPNWPRLWRDARLGQFTDADLAEWDEGMRAAVARHGGLVYALTFLVVAGRRY